MKSLMVVLATMVGLLMGFALSRAQVYEFSKPNVPVNDDSLGIREHYAGDPGQRPLRVRGDTLYAAWVDTRNRPSRAWDIYFAKSTDRGVHWLANIRVTSSTDTVRGLGPSLAIDDSGDIYVAWVWGEGMPKVMVSRSTDKGLTFQPGVTANNNAYQPCIEAFGRRVFVVSYSSSSCWLSQSTDGGVTFSPPRKVNTNVNITSFFHSFGLGRNGRAYVIWSASPGGPPPSTWNWLAIATDSADTSFLPERLVGDTLFAYQHHMPDIVVKDTIVYCVWIDGRNRMAYGWDIYFARSTDGGMTFGTNHLVSCNPHVRFLDEGRPSVAVDDSGRVYVTWDESPERDRIWFNYSPTGGDTFDTTVLVNDSSQTSGLMCFESHIEVGRFSGTPYVLWHLSNGSTYVDLYSARGEKVSGVAAFSREGGDVSKTLRIYPNPFRSKATVCFDRQSDNPVAFSVYNCLGQKVSERALTEREKSSGQLVWSEPVGGRDLPAGIYFCFIGGQAQKVLKLD